MKKIVVLCFGLEKNQLINMTKRTKVTEKMRQYVEVSKVIKQNN